MYWGKYFFVFNNIVKNFLSLKADFVGIGFYWDKIGATFINSSVSLLILLAYYLTGRKIRLFFFKKNKYRNLNCFIDVALGYISVNSGLAVLGVAALLYPTVLWTYILTIIFISIYPFRVLRQSMAALGELFYGIKRGIKNNKWVCLGIFLFIAVAYLRLIPPEVGEDAIGYHTGDPHSFLINHTTLLSAKAPPYVLPVPHLGEMTYMLSEFVGAKDSARYVHFLFYFLVIIMLTQINPYGALFFLTAPVVIQISSKANVDFQWILCWLLAIFLVTQKKLKTAKEITLIGILFGGVLATKLWTIAFLPLFILYMLVIYRKSRIIYKLNLIVVFFLWAILIDGIWLWRSFVISGNPLYPVLSTVTNLSGAKGSLHIESIVGFNSLMFHMENVSVFSPLFFLGIAILTIHWRHAVKVLQKFSLSLFFSLLFVEYLSIRYHFGRYLLGLYALAVLVVSVGINKIIEKHKLYKAAYLFAFTILFFYYFANTLLILPYGLGWADSNRYLTRILYRDNASYYDFDHSFGKWISKNDKIATYGIYGYYYANFNYVDVNYVFDEGNKSLELLRQKNITKLLINGGDILWFCNTFDIYKCSPDKLNLIASYPEDSRKLNLYEIKAY